VDKSKPLGQRLVEQGALTADARDLLEALVQKHLQLHDNDTGKCLAALRSVAAPGEQLPLIAKTDVAASLSFVEMSPATVGDPFATLPPPTKTGALSCANQRPAGHRFRVLRSHAKGGLGEVSVAFDEELHREVALKEIQAHHADADESRARFIREAEITGKLEHPGVVPVYSLGQYTDGRPFYAMRFIQGESLQEAIEQYHRPEKASRDPSERAVAFRRLIGRFVEVCNAMAYAHSRRILHRDLKPDNIMLGPFGETLVVDWGLAKPLDLNETPAQDGGEASPAAANDSAATQAGVALGTPQFMSPEQAAGQHDQLGPASDVYSLGATLYCLLTGRPPYEGNDVWAILERLRQGESPPPPRSVNRNVPRALDAICRKAMTRAVEARYSSARALADDLEHWLADEPVSAYRAPWHERLARWARRHRTWVTGAAALLLTAVVTLSISTVLIEQAREGEAAQRRLAAQRADAEAQAKESLERQLYFNHIALAERGFSANDMGRAAQLLKECPPRLRDWEWRYLNHRRFENALSLTGHRGFVFSVAFSPDDRRLATSSLDGTVKLWDAVTGQELRTLRPTLLPLPVVRVAFSHDGRQIAAAIASVLSPGAKIWDTASGKELFTLRGHQKDVLSVAYSPDGRYLATTSWDHTIKVWDPATGKELRTIRGHHQAINEAKFSPDGIHLATAAWDGSVKVWDVRTGQECFTCPGQGGEVWSVAYDRDGKRLASAHLDGTVKVWDAADGRELLSVTAHFAPVQSVAFSHDGHRLVSASWDRTIRFWDPVSGDEILSLRQHNDTVSSLAFSSDGQRLASTSWDGTVLVRSAASVIERAPHEIMTLQRHDGTICSVAYSADGQHLASAGWDGNVHIWDTRTGQNTRTLRGQGGMLIGVRFAQDGRRLAMGGADGVLQIWDAITGREIQTIRGPQPGCWSLAYSGDGQLAASAESYAGTVHIWEAATGRPISSVPGSMVGTLGLAFSPDHRHLASVGFDKAVKIWDVQSGALLQTFTGHNHFTENVAYRPDGKQLASASWDSTIRVWDAATGKELHTLSGHADRVFDVVYSEDGRRLASSSWDGTVKVWDAATGKELLTLRGHSGIVMSVAFSPDGRRLASCSGSRGRGEIKIWDLSVLDGERTGK
jgi:WD40 repeat protein/tRNA A-37 threonylcarbamoyl transferase component Bud32